MPSAKGTAFLIIHGVGAHTPFATCDSFVRGFYDVLSKKKEFKDKQIPVEHKIKQREDWAGKSIPWVQNYISMTLPGKNEAIDFYEYYWDIYMVHEARFAEAFKMISTASKGANKFYKRLDEHLSKQEDRKRIQKSDLGKYGRTTKFGLGEIEFRPTGYYRLLGPIFTFLSIVLPYIPFAMWILDKWAGSRFPIISQMFNAFTMLKKEPVPDFIGDLVRYLNLDPRSEHYETRRRIINGALDELIELMKDKQYKNIIVAGHSLGSVIAYDVLNRVVQEINAEDTQTVRMISPEEAEKITGFVTFGSPLDKIAFFFHERVEDEKSVQRQVLSNLHAFKTFPLLEDKGSIDIGNPMKFQMESTRWLNFYHPEDLISGYLDFYDIKHQSFKKLKRTDGNIEIEEDFGKLKAHSCYWGGQQASTEDKDIKKKERVTNQMYEEIIKEFFQLK